jgi:hypothetical protein
LILLCVVVGVADVLLLAGQLPAFLYIYFPLVTEADATTDWPISTISFRFS